ncbi:helix-turn-helix domain-containing protein [Chryseobacterium sp. ERMR1:04]|uniref:helix-turn-helix domain-containing protein n=1 Tax=Chryseobacterium sp. ERMR1:04 TaxID=1705393 RepID=UPI0006C85AB8|nr:AraC family transcriptional regulator [Chryseobacterium sp. ERMR1:04]KPH14765.1 hypothetical protein AMQ68_04780 [Chryseobacterium sp. ERMR1:04]
MIKLNHIDSIQDNWTKPFVEKLNFKIIENKYLLAPEDIWDGGIFYKLLSDNLSLAVIDYIAKKEIEFIKASANSDFWYLIFDLSDGINNHILNNSNYEVGNKSNYNFGFIDGTAERKVIPNIGTRTYSFRIVIRKSYFEELIRPYDLGNFNTRIQENIEEYHHYYGYVDSTSKIILNKIINKKFGDANYELIVQACAYKLLGVFLKNLVRYNSFTLKHAKADLDAIINTKKHIIEHIWEPFMGVDFLASEAGMSQTKFKSHFKDFFGLSPAIFYKIEKLKLAKELLETKKYDNIKELSSDLNFGKSPSFAYLFKEYFGIDPHDIVNY